MIRMMKKADRNKNVIVHENHNKKVREFQIKTLPHPFKNKDQFNYINN
jgi:U3 small nucleolar RNA-associated protein 14